MKKSGLFWLIALLGALTGGCSMHDTRESSVPWAQPANWEGQVPGMGTGGGSMR